MRVWTGQTVWEQEDETSPKHSACVRLTLISVIWLFVFFFFVKRKVRGKNELNDLKTKLLFGAERHIVFGPS